MVGIRNFIRKLDNLAFQSTRRAACAVVQNPIAYLPRQVKPHAVLFQPLHNAQALFIMREAACVPTEHAQFTFPRMTKGRMSQIVPQCNSFRQILIQLQRARNRPRNLRNLQRMR